MQFCVLHTQHTLDVLNGGSGSSKHGKESGGKHGDPHDASPNMDIPEPDAGGGARTAPCPTLHQGPQAAGVKPAGGGLRGLGVPEPAGVPAPAAGSASRVSDKVADESDMGAAAAVTAGAKGGSAAAGSSKGEGGEGVGKEAAAGFGSDTGTEDKKSAGDDSGTTSGPAGWDVGAPINTSAPGDSSSSPPKTSTACDVSPGFGSNCFSGLGSRSATRKPTFGQLLLPVVGGLEGGGGAPPSPDVFGRKSFSSSSQGVGRTLSSPRSPGR